MRNTRKLSMISAAPEPAAQKAPQAWSKFISPSAPGARRRISSAEPRPARSADAYSSSARGIRGVGAGVSSCGNRRYSSTSVLQKSHSDRCGEIISRSTWVSAPSAYSSSFSELGQTSLLRNSLPVICLINTSWGLRTARADGSKAIRLYESINRQ